MKLEIGHLNDEKLNADCIVFPVYEGLLAAAENSEGKVPMDGQTMKSLGFSGKKLTTAYLVRDKLLIIYAGLGPREKSDPETFRRSYSKAIKEAAMKGPKTMAIAVPDFAGAALETSYAATLSLYEFDTFRNRKRGFGVDSIYILSDDRNSVMTGNLLGEATNFTREMANLPPSIGTPTLFENKAREIRGLKIEVLGREDFLKMGMGGLEGVSRAAKEPAKLVIMEYAGSTEEPLLIVGKGITFDSGGISLKPPEGMGEMKFDKCGAAAVLGTMKLLSDLRMKKHVVGIMALTENLPGGNAYKPGDILKHYNGKTSEIISTDAEGRLVLADALSYGVEKYRPSRIIDLATLTGACVIALGNNFAGMMGNDDSFQRDMVEASRKTWEQIWRLPLDDDFKDQINSKVADIKNTGGRPGGAETAAAFLSNFVGETPWVHLDIAGTAWTQEKTVKVDYLPEGATGFGVRLLYEYLNSH